MPVLTLVQHFHCQSISKRLYLACVLVCTFNWDFFPEHQAHSITDLPVLSHLPLHSREHHVCVKLSSAATMLHPLSVPSYTMELFPVRNHKLSQASKYTFPKYISFHSPLFIFTLIEFFFWTFHLKMKYLISMPPVFSHEIQSLYEPYEPVLLETAFLTMSPLKILSSVLN